METGLNVSRNVLRRDEGGVCRVGESRVSLDSVVYAFHEGASAEEVVLRFPTLELVQVYSVISYYLQNRDEIDKYLAEQRERDGDLKRQIESRFSPAGVREKLLARAHNKK